MKLYQSYLQADRLRKRCEGVGIKVEQYLLLIEGMWVARPVIIAYPTFTTSEEVIVQQIKDLQSKYDDFVLNNEDAYRLGYAKPELEFQDDGVTYRISFSSIRTELYEENFGASTTPEAESQ